MVFELVVSPICVFHKCLLTSCVLLSVNHFVCDSASLSCDDVPVSVCLTIERKNVKASLSQKYRVNSGSCQLSFGSSIRSKLKMFSVANLISSLPLFFVLLLFTQGNLSRNRTTRPYARKIPWKKYAARLGVRGTAMSAFSKKGFLSSSTLTGGRSRRRTHYARDKHSFAAIQRRCCCNVEAAEAHRGEAS
jgi:hypothetical protein